MAPEYAFLIFLGADTTTAEKDPHMPNLPSPPALPEVAKDNCEDDGSFEQVGREELDQHLDKAIQDLTLTNVLSRPKTSEHECSVVIGPTANALSV